MKAKRITAFLLTLVTSILGGSAFGQKLSDEGVVGTVFSQGTPIAPCRKQFPLSAADKVTKILNDPLAAYVHDRAIETLGYVGNEDHIALVFETMDRTNHLPECWIQEEILRASTNAIATMASREIPGAIEALKKITTESFWATITPHDYLKAKRKTFAFDNYIDSALFCFLMMKLNQQSFEKVQELLQAIPVEFRNQVISKNSVLNDKKRLAELSLRFSKGTEFTEEDFESTHRFGLLYASRYNGSRPGDMVEKRLYREGCIFFHQKYIRWSRGEKEITISFLKDVLYDGDGLWVNRNMNKTMEKKLELLSSPDYQYLTSGVWLHPKSPIRITTYHLKEIQNTGKNSWSKDRPTDFTEVEIKYQKQAGKDYSIFASGTDSRTVDASGVPILVMRYQEGKWYWRPVGW